MLSCDPSFFSQQDRYLSLPGSRLVINPYNFESMDSSVSQAACTDQPSLPLHIGYCCPHVFDRTGFEWRDAVSIYRKGRAGGSPPAVVWDADFGCASRWLNGGDTGVCGFEGDCLSLGNAEGRDLNILQSEVFDCPVGSAVLECEVAALGENGRLALKISRDGWTSGVCLFYIGEPCSVSIPLSSTGWEGNARVSLQFHVLGPAGETARLTRLRVLDTGGVRLAAARQERRWDPAALTLEATYPDGGQLKGTDYLADSQTVVRRLDWLSPGSWVLAVRGFAPARLEAGRLRMSTAHQDARVEMLTEDGTPAQGRWRLYPCLAAFLSDCGVVDPGPDGACAGSADGGAVWSFEPAESPGALLAAVHLASSLPPVPQPTAPQPPREFWTSLLGRVPRPDSFHLRLVPSGGVTDADLEKAYYTAWAQIIANWLPAAPEVGYRYASMSTGKASLWAYGAKACSYAASWETFYGLMLFAQIDADAAWEAYLGFMTLVDKDGQLGGESLPSVKARTAWVLYQTSPDKTRLYACLSPLERYLTWRIDNLRWIYLNKTPRADQRDIDFVASAILDVGYLERICRELSLPARADVWRGRRDGLYRRMANWFFAANPCQFYYEADGVRDRGKPICILKALHLPELEAPEETALKRLFFSVYDPNRPFGGLDSVKAETMAYTLYGLAERGLEAQAASLREQTARDITLSRFFAEEYVSTPEGSVPSGVRPSLFGCALLIDCVFGMNGLRLDDGAPLPSGETGAVRHVLSGGRRIDWGGTDSAHRKEFTL